MNRLDDTIKFYQQLDGLEAMNGGKFLLANCHGRMKWPQRGIYFFFEDGELRSGSGRGPRVVRVGTHALMAKSGASLWNRLKQHRGTLKPLGGNHRGSIFRLLVGDAMIRGGEINGVDTWGHGSNAPCEIREVERPMEVQVSRRIGAMPFLTLPIDDPPGPDSLRGYIERNAVGLLSSYSTEPVDPMSVDWLGLMSSRERVRKSGLWNNNHVDENYDPDFLQVLRHLVLRV